jgi:hypothetical protein
MDEFKKWLQQLSSVALLTNKDIPVPIRTKATPGGETYKKFVQEGRADLKGDIKKNNRVKPQDITKYKTIVNAMLEAGEIKKQEKPYTFEWIRENYKKFVQEGRADLKGEINSNKKVKPQDITKYKTIINAMLQEGEITKQESPIHLNGSETTTRSYIYLFIRNTQTFTQKRESPANQPHSHQISFYSPI